MTKPVLENFLIQEDQSNFPMFVKQEPLRFGELLPCIFIRDIELLHSPKYL